MTTVELECAKVCMRLVLSVGKQPRSEIIKELGFAGSLPLVACLGSLFNQEIAERFPRSELRLP